jgi:xanthine dehydrogenase YagS FAD-binding subunit
MQLFQMAQPATIKEAVDLLAAHGSDARAYAGGQDLLYRFKRRIATNPLYLVNLKDIAELQGFDLTEAGALRIRPLTTLGELERSPTVQRHFPLLHSAISEIASPQIRNQGTVGGNLLQDVWCWYLLENYDCWLNGGKYCYAVNGDHRYYHSIMGGQHCIASHPADLAPALIALEATATVTGPRGTRTLPVAELWQGFQRIDGRLQCHTLRPDEVLAAVEVPAPVAGARGAFLKFRVRKSWDFALASVAASLRFADGRCVGARIVLGGIATEPIRARETEDALVGRELTEPVIQEAAARAVANARPLRMNHYKLQLVQGLCRKTLRAIAAQESPLPLGGSVST